MMRYLILDNKLILLVIIIHLIHPSLGKGTNGQDEDYMNKVENFVRRFPELKEYVPMIRRGDPGAKDKFEKKSLEAQYRVTSLKASKTGETRQYEIALMFLQDYGESVSGKGKSPKLKTVFKQSISIPSIQRLLVSLVRQSADGTCNYNCLGQHIAEIVKESRKKAEL